MKTSNWLIEAVGGPERAEKIKANALKKADKEIARKEKKERKKEMRAYRKMHRKHRKELVKHAKETYEWDYGWLYDSTIMQIRHMYEYYTARNNVFQSDDTLIPIIRTLKYVLDLDDELKHLWSDYHEGNRDVEDYNKRAIRELDIYQEIYSHIGENIIIWWD